MDGVRALNLGTVSDRGSQSNDCWFILLFAGLRDRVIDTWEITADSLAWGKKWLTLNVLVAVVDVENLPVVG